MGTPEFSLPGFASLIKEKEFEIIGVYTQSDKATGRKQELTMPPVKVLARENNLPVFQPEKIKTEIDNIKNLNPDLIVVIAYGQIIPPEILTLPKFGCINIHASLLPKYRGAACLNAPILNGDKETGITIMKMEAGLDTGPILHQEKIDLNGQEKLNDIHDRLATLSAKILVPTLKAWLRGELKENEQDNSIASYVRTIKKEDGKIDFKKPAAEIERLIRAYNPWPGSYGLLKGENLKIIEVKNEILAENDHKIGEFFIKNNELAIQCGQNSLLILKLQMPGKKALSTKEFLNGNKDIIGMIIE